MTITTTGIGFALSAIGLTFCGIHFFKAFRNIGGSRAGSRIGILLSTLLFVFAAVHGNMALGTLFFIGDAELFYVILIISHIFLTITAMLGAYLTLYILFPAVSPWPGTTASLFFGATLIFTTVAAYAHPFVQTNGSIDFNFSRTTSVLLAYVLFISIGSIFAIFTHSFFQAKSREVRVVSIVLAILAAVGILNVFLRFLLPIDIEPSILRNRIFDIGLILIGIIFIGVFVFPPLIINWLSKSR